MVKVGIQALFVACNYEKLSLVFTSDASTNASIRVLISSPFPCAWAYDCIHLRRVKMKYTISTRKFAACGQLKHSFQIPCI